MASEGQRLERCLARLRQLERELVEEGYVRRADGAERVREALRRIGEIGSPAGIVAAAAVELGTSCCFEGVLVSRLEGETMLPQSLWLAQGDERAAETLALLGPLALRYPLIEHEVVRAQRASLVDVGSAGSRAPRALALALGWSSYVVAPILLEGRSVGLMHAAAPARPAAVDGVDCELVALYCAGLGPALERAALREQLERQRQVLGSAIGWMNAALGELSRPPAGAGWQAAQAAADLLTVRELEVMRLLAEGRSNREIARALVLGEGTVKYHVKNILRKLRARSRSEAISRFAALGDGGPDRPGLQAGAKDRAAPRINGLRK
jgi:DNA-binding CsgD family transcriptional regulator